MYKGERHSDLNNSQRLTSSNRLLKSDRLQRSLAENSYYIQSLRYPLATRFMPKVLPAAREHYDNIPRDPIVISISEAMPSYLEPYNNIISAFDQNNVEHSFSAFQMFSRTHTGLLPLPVKTDEPSKHFLAFISALSIHKKAIAATLSEDPHLIIDFHNNYEDLLQSVIIPNIHGILIENTQTYADVIALLTYHLDDSNIFFEFLNRLASERVGNPRLGVYNRRNTYIDSLSITGNGTWANLREECIIPTSNYHFENGIWHTPATANLIPEGIFRSLQILNRHDFHGGCPVNHINMPDSTETPIARELKQITALAKQEYKNGAFNRIQIERV